MYIYEHNKLGILYKNKRGGYYIIKKKIGEDTINLIIVKILGSSRSKGKLGACEGLEKKVL